MRPAIIKQRTEKGLYYVVYPNNKTAKCTDQLRIAQFWLNQWNSQLTKKDWETQAYTSDSEDIKTE